MDGSRKAIFISEIGWRGIRELSLEALKDGMSVDVVLKGAIPKDVCLMISKPINYRLLQFSKLFFKIHLFFYLIWNNAVNDIGMIAVSREQTKQWLADIGFTSMLLIETEAGYKLV